MGDALRLITLQDSRQAWNPQRNLSRAAQPPLRAVVFAALDELMIGGSRARLQSLADVFAKLEAAGVCVVIWSCRTRAEIEIFREAVGTTAPFISEEGAALFAQPGLFTRPSDVTRRVAGYGVMEFGARYDELVSVVSQVAATSGLSVTTLSEMSIEQAATELRVPLLVARLVKLREYSELFHLNDARPASRGRLFRDLHAAGLTCRHDDPFDLVTNVADKGVALATFQRLVTPKGDRLVTVGIASRSHQLPVLHTADVRIVIPDGRSTETSHLLHHAPLAHVVEQSGLDGWIEALERVHARIAAH